jgi:AcrR family transcriptional regulator
MSTTAPTLRPGGRSARIQQAVHRAVRELQDEQGRDQLTVPIIAQRAGVTPSTIYRRWGDLHQLLADVAVELLRPDSEPEDTGTLRGDLIAWTEQYLEEMSSPQGRTFLRDVLSVSNEAGRACQCAAYISEQLEVIVERARSRGQNSPVSGELVDRVVAPVLYRILFVAEPPTAADATELVEKALATTG